MTVRGFSFTLLFLAACCGGGCVERRFVITSSPPGAIVYDEKNIPIGATPVDKPFTYYGKYKFTLVRDGYQTTVIEEDVRPPWYQWFLVDFFSENVIPYRFRDVRRLGGDTGYPLQPLQIVAPEPVLDEAGRLRERGRAIGGEPLAPPFEAPSPTVIPLGAPTP